MEVPGLCIHRRRCALCNLNNFFNDFLRHCLLFVTANTATLIDDCGVLLVTAVKFFTRHLFPLSDAFYMLVGTDRQDRIRRHILCIRQPDIGFSRILACVGTEIEAKFRASISITTSTLASNLNTHHQHQECKKSRSLS